MTTSNSANRELVLKFLNNALHTEVSALQRSKRQYYAIGDADPLREDLLERAVEESMHTDRLVERILELGGSPDFSHLAVELSPDAAVARWDVREVLHENLVAQRSAIENYQNILGALDVADGETRAVLEDIIRRDQKYVEKLARRLEAPGA